MLSRENYWVSHSTAVNHWLWVFPWCHPSFTNTSVNKIVTLLVILIGTRITLSLAHNLINITGFAALHHALSLALATMPLSDTFVSPAKGKLLHTKICYTNKPRTYSAITKNLLQTFHQVETAAEPPIFDLSSFPDFSKLPFPDNINQSQKDKIIHDSIVAYAANMASEATKQQSQGFFLGHRNATCERCETHRWSD